MLHEQLHYATHADLFFVVEILEPAGELSDVIQSTIINELLREVWTFIRKLRILRVEFIESPTFSTLVAVYLGDDEYRAWQLYLAGNPEAGDVMPGTGGFRKLRWADRRRGKGKRGGLRVIYYHLSVDAQIWFFTLYDKDEATDLSPAEKRLLKAAIDGELAQRAARRRSRRK